MYQWWTKGIFSKRNKPLNNNEAKTSPHFLAINVWVPKISGFHKNYFQTNQETYFENIPGNVLYLMLIVSDHHFHILLPPLESLLQSNIAYIDIITLPQYPPVD